MGTIVTIQEEDNGEILEMSAAADGYVMEHGNFENLRKSGKFQSSEEGEPGFGDLGMETGVCPRCGGKKKRGARECRHCAVIRQRARRYAEAVMQGKRLVLWFGNVE